MITLLLLASVAIYYVLTRSNNNQTKNRSDQFGRQYARAKNDEPEILDKGQTNGRSRRNVN
ncbi:MAG: hypothetical protein ABF679_04330 [Lentilactobacillus diolivorans]|uniref:Uncharacterized protein n=2 Tax=Lentilactobacillus diolivorans TaxID=179838 RepID=A0A0R1SI32_9LACO|nr:hypothetical protein [Lentilactobacillus diolivorans]KRL66114.1 hypothetical protein FC85_GL002960 [Lentilactobacillus diolivorans DSM 14421]GEP24965.1 hypothetical protein LDI01_25580 [Lentilactobacillus diolivorans]